MSDIPTGGDTITGDRGPRAAAVIPLRLLTLASHTRDMREGTPSRNIHTRRNITETRQREKRTEDITNTRNTELTALEGEAQAPRLLYDIITHTIDTDRTANIRRLEVDNHRVPDHATRSPTTATVDAPNHRV